MIRRIFESIQMFTALMRRSGTTTLIKKIASENDVWVLVPDTETKKQFGDSGVTFDELRSKDGFKPRPILIDNYTLMKLSDMSIIEFNKLNMEIRERNELLIHIREKIKTFERIHGNLNAL